MTSQQLESSFHQALQSYDTGAWEQALQAFQDIVQTWPDCKEAWFHLGEISLRQGHWLQATDMFERVLEIDPEVQEVYFQLGLMALQQGTETLAEAYLLQAIQLNADYHEARYQLGLFYARLGQAQAAQNQFQTLLQRTPELSSALWQSAQTQSLLGQPLEAIALCQALRSSETHLEPTLSLLEIQALNQTGQDHLALERIRDLPTDWSQALQELYVPQFLQTETEAKQARERVHKLLSQTDSPFAAEALAQLPRFTGWYLLQIAEAVNQWLLKVQPSSSAAASASLGAQTRRQRLVWIVDASSLPWQSWYFKHLASLPSSRWELHLLLRSPVLEGALQTQPLPSQRLQLAQLLPLASEAQAQIRDLAADVLLFSNPDSDGLQFYLAHQRLASLQAAWSALQPVADFTPESHQALDGSVPLWPCADLPSPQSVRQKLLFPLSALGYTPQDLACLEALGAEVSLEICADPLALPQLNQLQQNLSRPAELTLWKQPAELAQCLAQAKGLLQPRLGGELYTGLARSQGLPCLQGKPEACLQTLKQAEGSGPAHHQVTLLETTWAVRLQDRLSQQRKQDAKQHE